MATTHIRWSDTDRYFGPFTYAKDKYRNLAVVLGSGDDEDYPHCRIRFMGFGHTLILALPPILQPYKIKHKAVSWDAATIERLGRDWYEEIYEREYGFSYGNDGGVGGGFLQLFLGRQTHSSKDTQSWSCFTPWNNWRFIRISFYGLTGEHFYTEPAVYLRWDHEQWEKREACPTQSFSFVDYDGEVLTAKTRIEEREWRYGTGWFKWLSWFVAPKIRRNLDIHFSGQTGKRKGSWKGGIIGTGIEMMPNELHEQAFRRYCLEHDMTFKESLDREGY